MSEETIAEGMLASVCFALSAAEKLMESEDIDVQVFALDTFAKLAEIELSLLEALGRKRVSNEPNPLARRARIE